jgi:hypothetical protein
MPNITSTPPQARENEMQNFIIEYLTTNRHGGLVDKVAHVRALSADEARAKFAAGHTNVAIGFVGLDDES